MNHNDIEPLQGYPLEYGILLAALIDSTNEWLGEVGTPTEDAIVWQPIPNGHSIGGIVLHLADVELAWFEETVLKKPLSNADKELYMSDQIDVDAAQWPAPPRQPWSWYLKLLADARKRALAAVRDFPAPNTVIQGRRSTFTARWVVAHVVEHDSYHGGQIALLHEQFLRRDTLGD